MWYRKYLGYFEIPEDVDDMLRIKKILKKKDVFNPRLTDAVVYYISVSIYLLVLFLEKTLGTIRYS